MKKYFLIPLFLLNIVPIFSQNIKLDIGNFKLLNSNEKQIKLSEITGEKPFCIVLLSPECPISQKYMPILNTITTRYPEIQFLGVFTKWDKMLEIKQFKEEYALNMAVFKDIKNKLVKKIGGEVMPEVFLFNKESVIIYNGAIDNWFYALGKHRQEPTECYLEDAINEYFNNKEITIKHTQAIGCIIEK